MFAAAAHPGWILIRLTVFMVSLVGLCCLLQTECSAEEICVVVGMFMAAVGTEQMGVRVEARHPFWGIARLAILLLTLFVLLYMLVDNFDSTEERLLTGMFLALGGNESWTAVLKRMQSGKQSTTATTGDAPNGL
jgi:uncharacterized membrane protein HdeD (DUF308 family)